MKSILSGCTIALMALTLFSCHKKTTKPSTSSVVSKNITIEVSYTGDLSTQDIWVTVATELQNHTGDIDGQGIKSTNQQTGKTNLSFILQNADFETYPSYTFTSTANASLASSGSVIYL